MTRVGQILSGLCLTAVVPFAIAQSASSDSELLDQHRVPSLEERECFARYDQVFGGWWVLSPSSAPSCEVWPGDEVRCEERSGRATLEPLELPNGDFAYRCGRDVVHGAGCVFVPGRESESFQCQATSGISLVCLREDPERECAREIRDTATRMGSKTSELDYAHCERESRVTIYNVTTESDLVMDCSIVRDATGERAFCATEPNAVRHSEVDASCKLGCMRASGGGSCTIPLDRVLEATESENAETIRGGS